MVFAQRLLESLLVEAYVVCEGVRLGEKQVPFGNDNKKRRDKSKGNDKSKDNDKSKGKSNGKSNSRFLRFATG